MSTILGGFDQASLMNLEEFLRRGSENLGGPMLSSHTSSPHSLSAADSLSPPKSLVDDVLHGPEDSGIDLFKSVFAPLHSGSFLLPPAGLLSAMSAMPAMPVLDMPDATTAAASVAAAATARAKVAGPAIRSIAAASEDGDSGDEDGDGQEHDVFAEASQRVQWVPNEMDTWHRVFDAQMAEIPQPGFRAEVEKGFKHCKEMESWVCQKKNHFQISLAVKMQAQPAFVSTRSGLLKVSGLFVNVHGIKLPVMGGQSAVTPLEQSLSDRSKQPFAPQPLALLANDVTKLIIGRLHFSETTANNMRKRGKPNPDQRYFALVVSLTARAGDSLYTIASHVSDRVIVRASNPGQFETESNVHWVKGQSLNSVIHNGPVGINVDCPEDALCVRGNIRLSGAVLQPSDVRLKTDIAPLASAQQLANIRRLGLYRYRLSDAWAATCGREGLEANECGVLAQEVAQVLPEAVRTTSTASLADGSVVPGLLMVNKERVFMESVGAVRELGAVAERMHVRVDELETKRDRLFSALRRSSSLLELQQLVDEVQGVEAGKDLPASLAHRDAASSSAVPTTFPVQAQAPAANGVFSCLLPSGLPVLLSASSVDLVKGVSVSVEVLLVLLVLGVAVLYAMAGAL